MAADPSRLSPFSLRPAVAGDFDAYMDAFGAVAAEGRWMGAEAPIDRAGRRHWRSAEIRSLAGPAALYGAGRRRSLAAGTTPSTPRRQASALARLRA